MSREPCDLLKVGEVWGRPGDTRVVVHRVDPAGNRCQIELAGRPPPGKRWAAERVLKPGQKVTLRREVDGRLQAIEGTVRSLYSRRITLADLQIRTIEAHDQAREES